MTSQISLSDSLRAVACADEETVHARAVAAALENIPGAQLGGIATVHGGSLTSHEDSQDIVISLDDAQTPLQQHSHRKLRDVADELRTTGEFARFA